MISICRNKEINMMLILKDLSDRFRISEAKEEYILLRQSPYNKWLREKNCVWLF